METLKGIAVSAGIVIGRVFVLDDERRRIARRQVSPHQVTSEHARLTNALTKAIDELTELRDETQRQMGEEAAAIFLFHMSMLADPTLTRPMHERIDRDRVTAEFSAWQSFHDLAGRFAAMASPTLQTKVDDVNDLSSRVLRHLIGEHATRLKDLDQQAVVVARDLTPSQTAAFDRSKVIAFATDLGGKTSHTAIFARALGIPAVMGVSRLTESATDGAVVIVDGNRGVVILDPDDEHLESFRQQMEAERRHRVELTGQADLVAETRDGTRVELLGNMEFAHEVPGLLEAGAEGIGLYRTEFLYLTRNHEPTEEEHFEEYKAAVEQLGGRTLVIRTVDLGADKYTQAQFEEPERNPFLGCRSIRYCLQSLPMFKTQLRAILRASAFGPMKIMFPLITSVTEFRQGRYLINDVMEDLEEEGLAFDARVPIGMMVEVPSAALMADVFAREAAFFSIGTNDLVQYTLAVDRTNERVASMFNPAHPAVIRLIRMVVEAGARHGTPVSCCGEMAGESEYALLLVGLGLRTLSVTGSAIPRVKQLIRGVSLVDCERLAERVCSFDSEVTAGAYLRDQVRRLVPEAFEGPDVD